MQVITDGAFHFWINGVKVVTPISTVAGAQTSTGTGFTIGNANSSGSLFISPRASFCGNQSDFLIFSNVVPDSGVKAMSDYLMKENGIRGGTAINLHGDSIMIGAFSTSGISNFLGLVQYYNPNTLVSDFGISGAVSGQILGYMTNNGAAQPPTTGNAEFDCWYAGVNDSLNGVTLATWESNTTNAMNYSHRLGHKFDIFEIASYAGETGNTITRAAMNSFIDGLSGQVDAIFPLGHDPIMGTNGASVQSGTIYFANSIHPSNAGYYQEYTVDVGPYLQAQLSGSGSNYLGNFTGTFSGNGSGITGLNASNLSGVATIGNHIPSAVTVGSSPFSYTNASSVAQECYFSGGVSAYAIAKNGVSVYGSLVGNDYFVLQPTNFCTITWSVNAPTMYTNSW